MRLTIEIEQEEDGRWLSEVPQIPGVMVYGNSQQEAILKVQSLALHVLADKLEHGETLINMDTFFSVVAA
ncbi:MAG: type II toxin-antitoxin system HicB family antitoxin [Candidatus Parabeggiatoa sp. nov. 1]|jgi:predicted RNase H-like HicB family nuclease|nr:MAG: type II toxin-antitoxin system HicB family antitoxin [Gammaproteobacteria bacterium]